MSETGDLETFCQICRHPSDDPPGHEPDCPVYTGEPQRGVNVWPGQAEMQAASQQEQVQGQMGQMGNVAHQCPFCGLFGGEHQWAGSGQCPGVSTRPSAYGQWYQRPGGYPETPYGYSDIDPRILAQFDELKGEIRAFRQEIKELRRELLKEGG